MNEWEIDQLDIPEETKEKLKQLWLDKSISKGAILKNEGGSMMDQDKVWQKITKEAKESYPSEHEAVAIAKHLEDRPSLYNDYLNAVQNELTEVQKNEVHQDANKIIDDATLDILKQNQNLTYEQAYVQAMEKFKNIASVIV